MADMFAAFRNRFKLTASKDELSQKVMEILPLEEYTITSIIGSLNKFHAIIECNIPVSSEFVKLYNIKSKETLEK